jgi:hypothetical protein
MPSNTRQAVQRRLDQAIGNLETAKGYVMEEGMKYKDIHDDYFQVFGMITMMIDLAIAETASLRDKI